MTFEPTAGNSTRPDRRQLEELVAELRWLADVFELGLADDEGKRWSYTMFDLMARAQVAKRDGFPMSRDGSGGGRGGFAPDGSRPGPVPGMATAAEDEDRQRWWSLLTDLQVMVTYGRHACTVLAKATPAQRHPDRPEFGCRICSRPGKPEPIYASERCRWCWDFWRLWKVDAPVPILKLRREGKRITENVIRAELAEEMAG